MRDMLNTPLLFLLFLTILIVAIIHLGQWAGRKTNNRTLSAFFFANPGQPSS